MSSLQINIIEDPEIFVKNLENPDPSTVYGFVGKYIAVKEENYEVIVETFVKYDRIGCVYSDILLDREGTKYPVFYQSFYPGMMDTNILIHSPIFVRTHTPIKLQNPDKLKVVQSHVWIKELQTKVLPYHIPKPLFQLCMDGDNNRLLEEDMKILNEQCD
jgi:hypothetical protein